MVGVIISFSMRAVPYPFFVRSICHVPTVPTSIAHNSRTTGCLPQRKITQKKKLCTPMPNNRDLLRLLFCETVHNHSHLQQFKYVHCTCSACLVQTVENVRTLLSSQSLFSKQIIIAERHEAETWCISK